MFTKKTLLRAVGASLAAVLSLAAQPLRAQGSDAERLQKLEQAVSQLQKRNAELEQEVSGLKKRTSWEPVVGRERQNQDGGDQRRKDIRRESRARITRRRKMEIVPSDH